MTELPIDGETQAVFAARVGLSQPRVCAMVKNGMPILPNKRINVPAALIWMETNLDPERRRKSKLINRPKTKPRPPPTMGPAPPEIEVLNEKVAEADATAAEVRMEHEKVKLEREKLELEKFKRTLIPRLKVETFIFERFRRQRNAHEAWARTISQRIAAQFNLDRSEVYQFVSREMRDHLEAIANTPLDELPDE